MTEIVRRFYADVDVFGNHILNQVVEEVASLPDVSEPYVVKGRIVQFDGGLWMFDGREWQRGAVLVSEWGDVPSDVGSPSESLVVGRFLEGESRISALEGREDVSERRLDAVESRVDSVEARMDAVESHVDGTESRLDALEPRVDAVESRVDSVEAREDVSERRLDAVESRTDGTESRLDALEPRVDALEVEVAQKTDKTMAIPLWESDITYPQYATVMVDGDIYVSQQEGNTGNDPLTDDGSWWRQVSGSSDSFVTVIGDGVNSEYVIDHGFGTYNVFATFRTNDEVREYVGARYTAYSLSAIKVSFGKPVAEGAITVIIGRAGGEATDFPTGKGFLYEMPVPSQEWRIQHGLNGIVAVQTVDSEGREIHGSISQASDGQSVTVTFDVPTAGMAVCIAPNQDDVFRFPTATNVWTVRHSHNRLVVVQCYDNLGSLISGDVVQDLQTMASVTVTFDVPTAGYAVIL